MDRENSLAKNTVILGLGTVLPKLASFVTLPILTGYLSQEEYGSYDLILVLCSLYLPALTLQIQTAAFRYLIDLRDRDNEKEVSKVISNVFLFVLGSSIAALLILYFCLFKYSTTLRILVCFYYFTDILLNVNYQIARGLSYNLAYSLSAILHTMFQVILLLIFVLNLQAGINGVIATLIISALPSLTYLIYKNKLFCHLRFSSISKGTLKDLLGYSWPMVPNNMSMWVMRVSDRFVLTVVLGPAANAVYAVANKIPNMLLLFQRTFTMAWQENASIYAKDSDVDEYYSSMFDFIYNFMAGTLGLIIAVTPIIFKILIRGNYNAAYLQMPILFIAMFFSCMASFLGGIYVAYKKTKSVGATTLAAAVCNVVVDLAMINWAGIYAASISTLVSYVVLYLYRLMDIQKLIKVKYHISWQILVLCLLAIESILCAQRNFLINCINVFLSIFVFIIFNKSFLGPALTAIKIIGKRR